MILLFVTLLAGVARADVVFPPPGGCPEGTFEALSHAGSWCAPTTCRQGCGHGQRCATLGLCVDNEVRNCGGRSRRLLLPCVVRARIVTGTCEKQDDCKVGRCQIADRCVSASYEGPKAKRTVSTPPNATEKSSLRLASGCQHLPSPVGAAFTGVALLASLALHRRSR